MFGKREQDGSEAERGPSPRRGSEADPPSEHQPDPPPTHHHPMSASLRPLAACVRLPRVVQGWSLLLHPALSSLPPTTSELLSLLSMRSLCCWHEAGEGGCVVGGGWCSFVWLRRCALSPQPRSPLSSPHSSLSHGLPCLLPLSLSLFSLSMSPLLTHALRPLWLTRWRLSALTPIRLRHSLPLSSSHSQLLTHFGVNVWTVVVCRLFSRR